jgi:mono/diheme cytochrome c family protein
MKLRRLSAALMAATFVTGAFLLPSLWAEDGAALYTKKCAACHGADGAGKKTGPALKGTKLSDGDIEKMIVDGKAGAKAPHTKAIAGLTKDDAKAIAKAIKDMK